MQVIFNSLVHQIYTSMYNGYIMPYQDDGNVIFAEQYYFCEVKQI